MLFSNNVVCDRRRRTFSTNLVPAWRDTFAEKTLAYLFIGAGHTLNPEPMFILAFVIDQYQSW